MDMDVTGYLRFCADVRGLKGVQRAAAIDRVVSDCDLSSVTRKMIGHLSKGYRQRVGLAQALLHNPDVLILDEPTSGLDPNQIRDILKLIHDLGKEKTVIHSTHILSEVEATSDRVLIINKGRIVAEGSPKDLMAGASGSTTYAGIKGADLLVALRAADFVESVQSIGKSDNDFERLAIRGKEGQGVAEKLFRMAVEKGWQLNELKTETARLEDVFAKLTRG
jgi:ABC-2 type transport system ATP-binding protein